MVKKKTNVQNVVIIILSILLLVSIGFGATYSYYNGKTNLVKGTITTANLSIELQGTDPFGQTAEFSISAPFEDSFLVPGNMLNNVQLNLYNKCNQETYMVVVFTLSAVKNDSSKEDVTDKLQSTPAIDFKDNTAEVTYVDRSVWKPIFYNCKNRTDTSYVCLVGLNKFAERGDNDFTQIKVLGQDAVKIPEEWDNVLQNCSVTISVTAYAIQAKGLGASYENPILDAQEAGNMEAKAQAIATAVLEICKVDVAKN